MNNVFLTGATGVVGSGLLHSLLDRPSTEVTLLVRADSSEHAVERTAALLESIGRSPREIGDRVQVVRGDITQANLGMNEKASEKVRSKCTHMVHSAGKVKLNQTIEEARAHSVIPAQQVIAFASSAPLLKKVDVLSTIGVAGRMEGNVLEQRLTIDREYHNTYEQSKAEAEELYWQALADGLPVTLHRPSMVVGDSRTGAIIQHQVFYYLCDFLSGRRTLGILPQFGSQMLDIVPVDYVVQCIVASMFNQESIGQVFHLCSGPSDDLRMSQLCRKVQQTYRKAGIACRSTVRLPKSVFASIAWTLGKIGPETLRRAAKTIPFFLAYLGRRQVFESQRTQSWFARAGIVLPEPAEYLERIVSRYLSDTKAVRSI